MAFFTLDKKKSLHTRFKSNPVRVQCPLRPAYVGSSAYNVLTAHAGLPYIEPHRTVKRFSGRRTAFQRYQTVRATNRSCALESDRLRLLDPIQTLNVKQATGGVPSSSCTSATTEQPSAPDLHEQRHHHVPREVAHPGDI